MPEQSVLQFFNETSLQLPFDEKDALSLISAISTHEKATFSFVEVVYVDEDEIIKVNEEHLSRNYVTDIISFRYDDDLKNQSIEGTLYCCAPRIKEQAAEYNQSEQQEYLRILVHGLLHLVGYDDQTPEDKSTMSALENKYLSLLDLT